MSSAGVKAREFKFKSGFKFNLRGFKFIIDGLSLPNSNFKINI